MEYGVWSEVWLRADYECQFWPDLFGPHGLTPSGLMIGAAYDFGRLHAH
ncbi:MAG: hypothetical protein ABSG62_10305 [Terracidiphilus sp.]